MKSNIKFILSGLTALLVAACATEQAPNRAPSASLSIDGKSAAYNGAVAAGKGTLNYQGRRHHFTMAGAGLGGTGVQTVSATGQVYGLNNLADFAGTYKGISKGLTLVQGKMSAKLTNENGVVVYLTGEREGLSTNGGVRAFKITLID